MGLMERLRSLGKSSSSDADRTKVIVLSVVVALLVLWAGYNLVKTFKPRPRAKEPQSAGWVMARELNEALANEVPFADTSFFVETDSPLKLKLAGQVKTRQDLENLKAFVKKAKPDQPDETFDFSDVHVLR